MIRGILLLGLSLLLGAGDEYADDAARVSVEAKFEQQETAILIAHGFSRDRYQPLLALFLGDPDVQTVINSLVSESRCLSP